MREHRVLDDDSRERAVLHALGSLDPSETESYEEHLQLCAPCRTEVESLRSLVADLSLLAPEAEPSADLRARLLARAAALRPPGSAGASAGTSRPGGAGATPPQTWKAWVAETLASDTAYALAAEAIWESTGFPGVETRRLSVDASGERVTMLVRMTPGTRYPAHVHRGAEECFVLDGDLHVGAERTLRAGDYKISRAGSVDDVQWTETGCLLLIGSSLHDEILSDRSRPE